MQSFTDFNQISPQPFHIPPHIATNLRKSNPKTNYIPFYAPKKSKKSILGPQQMGERSICNIGLSYVIRINL